MPMPSSSPSTRVWMYRFRLPFSDQEVDIALCDDRGWHGHENLIYAWAHSIHLALPSFENTTINRIDIPEHDSFTGIRVYSPIPSGELPRASLRLPGMEIDKTKYPLDYSQWKEQCINQYLMIHHEAPIRFEYLSPERLVALRKEVDEAERAMTLLWKAELDKKDEERDDEDRVYLIERREQQRHRRQAKRNARKSGELPTKKKQQQ